MHTPSRSTARATGVRIWADEVSIPTYIVGEPNRNPMFLDKRVYQGSSGRVYPYPVIDRILDVKRDERHRVVFLENRYLSLMVMPGLGGRIQYAYDKTNGYPFIYHNHVIKPALVGLTGPWLSGGIEFNWPQHHRPGTYCPVDYAIADNGDGSQTLWLSDIEPMWHLKGTLGLTLYPDRAYLEIRIRLFNPTAQPQSCHLWTNPAVHVNDSYQSIFPPDVHAVYDHGRRDVSSFPIARGTYYKVDYSRGVDISWYRNIPVPTSYMAASSRYDFIGGYDHGRRAGVLHVADHHVVPGKKQWVWGCGDFGRAWDRNLTDEDGPYAELMCGVFADNQPDFTWLQPYETKEATQYFYPFTAIGYARNATADAVVSLDVQDGIATLGAHVTAPRPRATIRLRRLGLRCWEEIVDLTPEQPFTAAVPLPARTDPDDLQIEVMSGGGEVLVAYTPEPASPEDAPAPKPASPIPDPREVADVEALVLAGVHLEQYRHATREPEHYYREALRRAPHDARANTALGLLLLRRGCFAEAEPFLRAAVRTLTRHNPNPADGEAHYHLGVCLRYRARADEAFDAFAKAAWSAAWRDAACLHLAQLAAIRGEYARALDYADQSLARNALNQKATHLRVLLLRRLARHAEALDAADAAVARDPLDFGARNERIHLLRATRQIARAEQEHDELMALMRREPHTHLEIAADYAAAGAYDDALDLLGRVMGDEEPTPPHAAGHAGAIGQPNARPMLYYMSGYYARLKGDADAARRWFTEAAAQPPDRCFPNSLDAIPALEAALEVNPRDARAAFYLGNLWYDKRQAARAASCWERARKADPRFATVHRNLALAYFNTRHEPAKALRALQRAFALDPQDARVLLELDLLKKRTGVPPDRRLVFLRAHRDRLEEREDLLIEYVTLLNMRGRYDEALAMLTARTFHPWEGGEGKVTGQYVASLLGQALRQLEAGRARDAAELLARARDYPPNLGEGKLHGAQENPQLYWLGLAQTTRAERDRLLTDASRGLDVPAPAVYYNDQQPDTIFYQGLALDRLGRRTAARARFQTLVDFGRAHLRDRIVIDYFAVSLPEFLVFDDDLPRRNEINCRYLMALGLWGLGRRADAQRQIARVLALDPNHQAARWHRDVVFAAHDALVRASAGWLSC